MHEHESGARAVAGRSTGHVCHGQGARRMTRDISLTMIADLEEPLAGQRPLSATRSWDSIAG